MHGRIILRFGRLAKKRDYTRRAAAGVLSEIAWFQQLRASDYTSITDANTNATFSVVLVPSDLCVGYNDGR